MRVLGAGLLFLAACVTTFADVEKYQPDPALPDAAPPPECEDGATGEVDCSDDKNRPGKRAARCEGGKLVAVEDAPCRCVEGAIHRTQTSCPPPGMGNLEERCASGRWSTLPCRTGCDVLQYRCGTHTFGGVALACGAPCAEGTECVRPTVGCEEHGYQVPPSTTVFAFAGARMTGEENYDFCAKKAETTGLDWHLPDENQLNELVRPCASGTCDPCTGLCSNCLVDWLRDAITPGFCSSTLDYLRASNGGYEIDKRKVTVPNSSFNTTRAPGVCVTHAF